MRWLVVCAIVLVAARAFAELRAPMDPPMVRACPRATSWDGVTQCLVKHGSTPHVVRTVTGAKLVQIDQVENGKSLDVGLLLYVEQSNHWTLAGLYMEGPSYEVLALEPVTIKQHAGYRIEIGYARPTGVSVDGVTSTPALEQAKESLYCSGVGWRCSQIRTSCDVFVHGKVWWTFHGNVTIGDGRVHIAGDRSLVGHVCSSSGDIYLGWPDT